MRFNILYLFLLLSLLGIFWIKENFEHQNVNVFFGTAETEERVLRVDFGVRVAEIRVAVGDKVKAGDTLLLLIQPELDQEIANKKSDIQLLESQRLAALAALKNEISLLQSEHAVRKSELESEISVLRTEASLQAQLRQNIGIKPAEGQSQPLSQVQLQEIAVLEESVRQLEGPLRQQVRLLELEQSGDARLGSLQISQLQREIADLHHEKQRLALLAPIDGFVSQLPLSEGEVVDAFATLLRLHSHTPTKIRGFIHESVDIAFLLGDTVSLTAAVRTLAAIPGVLVSSSPQLVELPIRLRKYAEVKAWGREIYIQLPPDNPFYIGEKVKIAMPNRVSQ